MGRVDQLEKTASPESKADEIIRKHMVFSMLGGAIPVPVLDLAAVTAVQLDMLKQLAANYDVALDAQSTRAFMTSLTSALGGSLLGRLSASAVKLVPGIGWAVGGVAQVVVTGGSTYAVGNLFRRLFREGKQLDSLDVAAVKEECAAYFEQGKEIAKTLHKKIRRDNSSLDAGDEQ